MSYCSQPDYANSRRRQLAELLITRTIPELRAGVREKAPDEPFDIATLYNNIYYFPVDDRVALLGHIRRFLGPGERDAAWSRLAATMG
jgi:4-hydroxy-2,2'-bipyrrole-5-carbaldehyde O-methyltransferase